MNYLIDPSDIINYDRTDNELELFWLFCGVVAGKTSTTQARLLAQFLDRIGGPASPFTRIGNAYRDGTLLDRLKDSGLGQYNRLFAQFEQSRFLNLRKGTLEEFEKVHGVGPKTARMFVMMTRPDQRVAALDTHVLKHLRENNIAAPLNTPPAGPTYRRLEQEFITLADKANMTVSDYDLMVWKSYAKVAA